MYTQVKKILLILFPRSVLYRCEPVLRYLHYLLYSGKNFQCNVCNCGLSHFIVTSDDMVCPRCGSIRRVRRLWKMLKDEFLADQIRVLDFSPSRSIYRQMEKGKFSYLSSDLSGNFISDVSYDITGIKEENESFDLVICYHILEHIENDMQAMKELWRVLKKGGHCLVQTPFKNGDIYEDDRITTPAAREQHFGQSDHVRIYSVKGLKNRLELAGFTVETRTFSEKRENFNGFSEFETVLVCQKSMER